MKKTLVLGASPNPARYSYAAVQQLRGNDHEVVAVGTRKGMIGDVHIQLEMPAVEGVDTVTLYLNPRRQEQYYDYILETISPKRIIFNPGTENGELMRKAREKGIEPLPACTLVMLSLGSY